MNEGEKRKKKNVITEDTEKGESYRRKQLNINERGENKVKDIIAEHTEKNNVRKKSDELMYEEKIR